MNERDVRRRDGDGLEPKEPLSSGQQITQRIRNGQFARFKDGLAREITDPHVARDRPSKPDVDIAQGDRISERPRDRVHDGKRQRIAENERGGDCCEGNRHENERCDS
jgi:hypothetical protein